MIDVNLPNTLPTKSPHITEFTERIMARLKPLLEGEEEIQNHVVEENGVGLQDERTQAIKLLKTVLKWLMASAGRSFTTPVAQQLQLLPLLFKVGLIPSFFLMFTHYPICQRITSTVEYLNEECKLCITVN